MWNGRKLKKYLLYSLKNIVLKTLLTNICKLCQYLLLINHELLIMYWLHHTIILTFWRSSIIYLYIWSLFTRKIISFACKLIYSSIMYEIDCWSISQDDFILTKYAEWSECIFNPRRLVYRNKYSSHDMTCNYLHISYCDSECCTAKIMVKFFVTKQAS